jgi:hypothetical protein
VVRRFRFFGVENYVENLGRGRVFLWKWVWKSLLGGIGVRTVRIVLCRPKDDEVRVGPIRDVLGEFLVIYFAVSV